MVGGAVRVNIIRFDTHGGAGKEERRLADDGGYIL